jgi:hypothetical protein
MAWRAGATLFSEIWPIIAARVKPDEFRKEFTERLLTYFLECDVDPADLEGLHPEVDAVLRKLAEFDQHDGEDG